MAARISENPKSEVINFRLTRPEKAAFDALLARQAHQSASDLFRRALLNLIAQSQGAQAPKASAPC